MVAKYLKVGKWVGGWLIIAAALVGGMIIFSQQRDDQLEEKVIDQKEVLVLRALERQNNFYRQTLGESPKTPEATEAAEAAITKDITETQNATTTQNRANIATEVNHELGQPQAVIIPHHLLAADLIKEALEGAKANRATRTAPKLIVLISPDHFEQVSADKLALANTKDIKTPFGIAETGFLPTENLSQIDFSSESFMEIEHGLWGVLPFLKFYFPQSEFLSLALRNKASTKEIEALGQQLKQLFIEKGYAKNEVLLVISSDFAHRQTLDTVQDKDLQSIQALKEFPNLKIDQVDNDCVGCWAFARGFLDENSRFRFINNKNSTDFGGGPTEITSYVTGYFVEDMTETAKIGQDK